jgi:hypothetical protein
MNPMQAAGDMEHYEASCRWVIAERTGDWSYFEGATERAFEEWERRQVYDRIARAAFWPLFWAWLGVIALAVCLEVL